MFPPCLCVVNDYVSGPKTISVVLQVEIFSVFQNEGGGSG